MAEVMATVAAVWRVLAFVLRKHGVGLVFIIYFYKYYYIFCRIFFFLKERNKRFHAGVYISKTDSRISYTSKSMLSFIISGKTLLFDIMLFGDDNNNDDNNYSSATRL